MKAEPSDPNNAPDRQIPAQPGDRASGSSQQSKSTTTSLLSTVTQLLNQTWVNVIQPSLHTEIMPWLENEVKQSLSGLFKTKELIPVMTYESAIEYFVTDRPADPRIVKGAILHQPHRQGQHLAQVFLDKNNQLVCRHDGKPYGRQLVAERLDEELLEVFDGTNLIIVE